MFPIPLLASPVDGKVRQAVDARQDTIHLLAKLFSKGPFPVQVAISDNQIALVGVLADAVGVGFGITADVAILAAIVPGEADGDVGGHSFPL